MINMNTISSWLFTVMMSITPKTTISSEDIGARKERVHSIADDIVSVVYDSEEDPLFSGKDGREKSAVFIATWAAYESGWYHRRVDNGTLRGDNGNSWCIMQLNIKNGKTAEGWTGKDLINDRKKCIRAGYHVMKLSMKTCKGPERDGMAAYMSGSCKWAVKATRKRYDNAMNVYDQLTLEKFITMLEDKELENSRISGREKSNF